MTPVIPRPAASVLLVRPGRRRPIEVYMVRRQKTMRFLAGYYAFPGGKVEPEDGAPEAFARCRGLDPEGAGRLIPDADGLPALAFWVAAAREVLEETGVLLARDDAGHPVDGEAEAACIAAAREAVLGATEPLWGALARSGWHLDLAPLRYLSHFITPPASPIRFTARFFLAPLPPAQSPRLFTEETSEGRWVEPEEGVRGWERGEMPMAEPAESGLRYLAGFGSLDELWSAHADGRHKLHGISDRLPGLPPRRPRGNGPATPA